MWQIKLLISKRLPIVSISLAFILFGIGFAVPGGRSMSTLGWVFIATGLALLAITLIKISRNEIPPLDVSVRKSKIVWGLWFTGDKVTEDKILEKSCSIKRLLLLDPKSRLFKEHIGSNDTVERARKQIKQLTRQARDRKIEVKWFFNRQKIGIMLHDSQADGEPSSDKAWCLYEEHDLDVPPKLRRRTIIKNNKEDKKVYRIYLNRYKDIWDKHSRAPDLSEYEDVTHTTA